jgi:hypothetical protein
MRKTTTAIERQTERERQQQPEKGREKRERQQQPEKWRKKKKDSNRQRKRER